MYNKMDIEIVGKSGCDQLYIDIELSAFFVGQFGRYSGLMYKFDDNNCIIFNHGRCIIFTDINTDSIVFDYHPVDRIEIKAYL